MKRLLSAVALATVIGTTLPAFGSDIHAMVSAAADEYGIPRHIAHGVVKIESGYRCNARNPQSNARGIMQVLPRTARSVGVTGNLFNCTTGLRAGMRYLKLAISRGGTGCAGVSLYERGVYARPRCTEYGRRVMRAAKRY